MLLKNLASSNFGLRFIENCSISDSSTSVTVKLPLASGVSITKSSIKSAYIDADNGVPTPTLEAYTCGGDSTSHAFTGMQSFELVGLEETGASLCQNAISLSNVTLHEGLKTLGNAAFMGCTALKQLRLPDTLTTVASNLCYDCQALQEIYIPADCAPISDVYTLSVGSATAASYVNGIVLKGPGAKAWKAALPDLTTYPFRKLILDPEWA